MMNTRQPSLPQAWFEESLISMHHSYSLPYTRHISGYTEHNEEKHTDEAAYVLSNTTAPPIRSRMIRRYEFAPSIPFH